MSEATIGVRLVLSGAELTGLAARAGIAPPAVVVVLDVLRATTTLAYAFAHGARRALAFETPEAARLASASCPAGSFLLCGERGGLRIDGFDLGNSPAEYTRDVVGDRTLLFTTTNGTRALARTAQARLQVLASYVNLGAATRRAAAGALDGAVGGGVWIVAAGKEERPCDEDTACALEVVTLLARDPRFRPLPYEGGPAAIPPRVEAALGAPPADIERFLAGCEHGRALLAVDPAFATDLADAARRDVLEVAPAGRAGVIERA